MPSIKGPDSPINLITIVSANTVQVPASVSSPLVMTIAGQQYRIVSNLLLDTTKVGAGGLDVGPVSASTYSIYLAVHERTLALVASLSSSAPSEFTAFRLIGRMIVMNVNSTFRVVLANTSLNISLSDLNPIGMVVSSMLTEDQFQRLNGSGWILMDGRSVAGSTYANITGSNNIPDARGLVLRGKNNGRGDGSQNPDGDSALGLYQGDAYASHKHGITLSHEANGGKDASGWPAVDLSGPIVFHNEFQTSGDSSQTNGAGTPLHNSGGNETRMRNITVNHFIRIN